MKNNKSLILFSGIVFVAALSRLIPHPWNLTPIGAMAIFSGAYLGRSWLMLAIPLFAYWISDILVMNLHYTQYYEGFQLFGSAGVYVALAAIILLSHLVFRSRPKSKYVFMSFPVAIVSSFLFYFITNTGAWLVNPIYPKSISGWLLSLEAGLPFFPATIYSYVIYSVLLFGVVHVFSLGLQDQKVKV